MEVLLKYGADVNAKDNFGRTAFIRAMERGKTDTLNLLRKYGARE
ncbi:MAG: ankyrin repeat domain-containing protein [Synergistaceae bacterium]|nr:ankyrin repeat domain-containing protein [Synergistaceae bacterium]